MLDSIPLPIGDDRGQLRMDLVSVIIAAIVALVVAFVGIFLMSEVIGLTQLSSGDPLYNTSEDFQDTTGTVFSMVGLAIIIAVVSVVIFYLYAVRGGR
jgi:hypothetical protein